jgi:ferrous iron transport protein A
MMPLGLLAAGGAGEIVSTGTPPAGREGDSAGGRCEYRLEELGLRVGRTVEMLNNGSPVLLKVGESRVALGRGLAMKIMIKEVAR